MSDAIKRLHAMIADDAATFRERSEKLETALRALVYFEKDSGTWRVGRHGDSDVTDVVGPLLANQK